MRRSWLLIATSLACGSDEPGSTVNGTTGASLVQAVCRNLLECRLIYDDASQTRQLIGVLDNCEGLFAEFVGDGEKTLFERDVSKLKLNSEQLAACVERFPHQCFEPAGPKSASTSARVRADPNAMIGVRSPGASSPACLGSTTSKQIATASITAPTMLAHRKSARSETALGIEHFVHHTHPGIAPSLREATLYGKADPPRMLNGTFRCGRY